MFHEALNAPWLLVILYLLPLCATLLLLFSAVQRVTGGFLNRRDVRHLVYLLSVALLLLGAGLALLGAAYLHDVWYC